MSIRSRRKNVPKGLDIKQIRMESQVAVWNPPSSPYDDPVYSFIRPDLTVEDLQTFTLEKDERRFHPSITPLSIYHNWLRSMGWDDENEKTNRECDDEISRINHRSTQCTQQEIDNINQKSESPLIFSPPDFSSDRENTQIDASFSEFFPSFVNSTVQCDSSSSPTPNLTINPNPFPHFSILNNAFAPLLPTFTFTPDSSGVNVSSTVYYNTPLIRPPSLSPQPKRIHIGNEPHSAFHRVIPMEEMMHVSYDDTQIKKEDEQCMTPTEQSSPSSDHHNSVTGFFIPKDVLETLVQMA